MCLGWIAGSLKKIYDWLMEVPNVRILGSWRQGESPLEMCDTFPPLGALGGKE